MALVVIITRDVADRYRGFLASVMLEIAPAVYISPRMNAGVRLRTWKVMTEWHNTEPKGSIVMVWRDTNETGGVGISTLGTPPKELVDIDGLWITRRSL
ncbi:type I-E CRISPR-associated endoribonuclease Cas2e [Thiolapillus sp.]|uniref:type I-E CRISPR-associated endoribonuclease Cas2e n=1 Tax=Thiolapillus sp. TaxID=2017437 RepID=UPI0025CCB95B|nr:type I-E CRISPR-associated endoribonuclease Cas2e [Thiolapillus sp.]